MSAIQPPPPPPIPTRQVSREIHGIQTTCCVQSFSDKLLIIVSQMGKIGSLTQASLPSSTPLPPSPISPPLPPLPALPPPHPSTTLLSLLGTAPSEDMRPLYELYVSQLAAIVWSDEASAGRSEERRPVVVGLALKPGKAGEGGGWAEERVRFGEVCRMVGECRVW